MAVASEWFVYVVKCSDGSLYTGIATDVERRFSEHQAMQQPAGAAKRGAKYFLGRRPLAVVYREGGHNRSSASRREAEIKKLTALQKQRLITTSQ